MENILWGILCVLAQLGLTTLVFKGLVWADNTEIPTKKKKTKYDWTKGQK